MGLKALDAILNIGVKVTQFPKPKQEEKGMEDSPADESVTE